MNKLVQQGPLKGCGGAVGCRVSSRLISPELDTRNLSFEKCLVALHSKRGIKEDKKNKLNFSKKSERGGRAMASFPRRPVSNRGFFGACCSTIAE